MSRSSVQVRSLALESAPRHRGALRFVVGGSNTGVGKTWLTTRLVRALRAAGLKVAVSKPIESGAERPDGTLYPEDAHALAAAAELDVRIVCPWPLPLPVTPAEEIERLGLALEMGDLIAAVERAEEGADVVFVESAGGLYSPLLPEADTIDLARSLDAQVLLVTSEVLGCIHDTTAAYRALLAAGVPVAAVALNRREDAINAQKNASWIRRRNKGVPLVQVGAGLGLDALIAALGLSSES